MHNRYFFVSDDGGGIKYMYADTIGLPIYFVYSKEKYIKEPKKKQKLKLEYRRLESNLGRLRESQVS